MGKRMQGGWLRLYSDILNNRKVGMLSDADFRLWIQVLLITNKESDAGVTPSVDTVAYEARTTPERVYDGLSTLCERGLLDKQSGGPNGYHYVIHDWYDWQYDPSTSAERMKRHRERNKSVTVTSPSRARASSEQTTEQNRQLVAHAREPTTSSQDDKKQNAKTPLRPLDDDGAETNVQASDAVFDNVWSFYIEFGDPRSRRPRAEAAWATISRAAHSTIVQGLVVWRLSRASDAPVKYLETWLEERGWRDYPLGLDGGKYAKVAGRWAAILLDETGEQVEAG